MTIGTFVLIICVVTIISATIIDCFNRATERKFSAVFNTLKEELKRELGFSVVEEGHESCVLPHDRKICLCADDIDTKLIHLLHECGHLTPEGTLYVRDMGSPVDVYRTEVWAWVHAWDTVHRIPTLYNNRAFVRHMEALEAWALRSYSRHIEAGDCSYEELKAYYEEEWDEMDVYDLI
jgi:hypothetical protein